MPKNGNECLTCSKNVHERWYPILIAVFFPMASPLNKTPAPDILLYDSNTGHDTAFVMTVYCLLYVHCVL